MCIVQVDKNDCSAMELSDLFLTESARKGGGTLMLTSIFEYIHTRPREFPGIRRVILEVTDTPDLEEDGTVTNVAKDLCEFYGKFVFRWQREEKRFEKMARRRRDEECRGVEGARMVTADIRFAGEHWLLRPAAIQALASSTPA